MKMLLAMFPTIVFIVYGQLIIKWRVQSLPAAGDEMAGRFARLTGYLADPYIISAYLAALAGSVAWMFVLERYAVSLAFPLYVGSTIVIVAIGGAALFGEPVTGARAVSILLILAGVAIGSRA